MKKIIICLISMFVVFANPIEVLAIEIDSTYAVALDVDTGMILYDKNAHETMYPASMTKVLTVYVALQFIDDLQATVTINSKDLEGLYEAGASVAYYAVGDVTTYEDLLYGVMLPSGADACQALAYRLFGSIEGFVDEMNNVVKLLGLTNTNFANPTGLDEDQHYTTAYEMAEIIRYVCQDEDLLEIFSTDRYTRSDGLYTWLSSGFYLSYNNDIDTSRIMGCKTGFTDLAQYCLASYNETMDRNIVVITGGYPEELGKEFTQDTNEVLDYVEAHYDIVTLLQQGVVLEQVEVKNVLSDYMFDIIVQEDYLTILPFDYNEEDLSISYSFDTLLAPIYKGDTVGTYYVDYQGQMIVSGEVISNETYKENILLECLFYSRPLYYGFIGVSGLLVLCLVIKKIKK